MFGISIRQRRMMRRAADYAIEPLKARTRAALRRDQRYQIAGHDVTLPPRHLLPWFQRRDPTYDRYAEAIVARFACDRQITVVDIGGNVGDTAVAMLGSSPNIQVVTVEGSSDFLPYLRQNVAPFGDRVTVIEGFVGPVDGGGGYASHGTSGGFAGAAGGGESEIPWVSVEQLLSKVAPEREVVWKSDIDGFDIHVLTKDWDTISGRAKVMWFEFDPARTLGSPNDVDRLIDHISRSGRELLVYDNLGRRMIRCAGRDTVLAVLTGLTNWMVQQHQGHSPVPYLDLWLVDPHWSSSLDEHVALPSTLSPTGVSTGDG